MVYRAYRSKSVKQWKRFKRETDQSLILFSHAWAATVIEFWLYNPWRKKPISLCIGYFQNFISCKVKLKCKKISSSQNRNIVAFELFQTVFDLNLRAYRGNGVQGKINYRKKCFFFLPCLMLHFLLIWTCPFRTIVNL